MSSHMNRPRPATLAALLIPLVFSGCDGLLDVSLPGGVTADAFENTALVGVMLNSVQAEVECAWNDYVAASSNHSDEWIQSSANAPAKRWGMRDIAPTFAPFATDGCGGASYGLFRPLHVGRSLAEQHFERISAFSDADVPNKTPVLAQIRAYNGWPYIAFAESFCAGTPVDGQPGVLSNEELFQRAVARFTDAIQLADQAGLANVRNMALVGRARANLGLQNYAAVIADAEQVPQGFRFNVTRDETPQPRQNAVYRRLNGPDNTNRHGSVAPSYRDVTWKGVPDPRVTVTSDGRTQGFDFSTISYFTDKVTSFATPVRLASWEEAQLFIAEAAAITGDLDRARTILDGFHTRAGIPPVTVDDIPTQADVIRHVIETRRRELFVEGGHRLRDHLRWRGTEFEIPFLGEPGSDHPNGVEQNGDPYSDTTCFPVPTLERTS